MAGGKWTTYREMAEDAVDKAVELIDANHHGSTQDQEYSIDSSTVGRETTTVESLAKLKPCSTLTLPLIGTKNYHRSLPVSLQRQFGPGLSSQVALHLIRTYGVDAFDVLSMKPKEAEDVSESQKSGDGVDISKNRKVGTLLVDGFPYLEEEVSP